MFFIIAPKLLYREFRGLAVYPFVFMKEKSLKENKQFVNHERIHLRQQLELLCIFFFIWYGFEFLFRLIQYKNSKLAYLNLSFEREAYRQQEDLDYLNNRPFFSFIKYL